jgi:hypothetical protein
MTRGLKEYSNMSMEAKLRAPKDAHRESYERSDADVRSLLKFGLSLFLILIAVLISMRWTFFYFAKSQQLGPPASPFENARVLPPEPRLQVEPRVDLLAYCEGQLRELNTYGWEDRHNEVVRIPVDRAMDLILERGLPARTASRAASGGTATLEAAGMVGVEQANGMQGPCGYLVNQPALEEKK